MSPAAHDRAAVVSVGDEIVLGQSLDTNSRWLADQLAAMGIMTVEHASLPDDAAALEAAFRRLAATAPLVLVTGGLGPTQDDLTRPALAAAAGETLVEDAAALADIARWLEARGRTVNALNRTQALRPASARCLPNAVGTAPGLAMRVGSADVFCLPGPPKEMTAMFAAHVRPALRPPGPGPGARAISTRMLHFCGLPESEAATRLADVLARGRNPQVGITVSNLVLTLRIRHEGDPREAPAALDAAERACRDVLGPLVFGSGDDTLAGALLERLASAGRTLTVVESCTGGLLGAALADVPGASRAFLGGWIAYANAMKTAQVAVPREALERCGAVSDTVARAMAEGGLVNADADHALAVTGVAGPGGGTEHKPVGTVFIARASRTPAGVDAEVRRFLLPGDRQTVRVRATQLALTMLWLHLSGAGAITLVGERR